MKTKKTTKVDGRIKVTPKMAASMAKLVAKGKSLDAIAEKYGVSTYAVKYNTDAKFKASEQARKRA